jgi:hypothetical protein
LAAVPVKRFEFGLCVGAAKLNNSALSGSINNGVGELFITPISTGANGFFGHPVLCGLWISKPQEKVYLGEVNIVCFF